MGPERGARSGRVDQPELWGEGQLLLGGVLGDGRGGVDGMSTAVEPCRKSPYRTFRATRGTSQVRYNGKRLPSVGGPERSRKWAGCFAQRLFC